MSSAKNVYIIDGTRTAIGKFRGSLSNVRADDMAAHVITELVKRNKQIPLDHDDDVIMGCSNQAGDDNRNIARMSLLLAGLPVSVPGETVNRLCASGMSAVVQAKRAIQADDGDLFIAGGVENMTRGPYVMSKTSKAFGTDSKLYDSSFGWRFINPKLKDMYGVDAMGVTAENLAQQYQIGREEQDGFALASQQKAIQAQAQGRFKKEITPMEVSIGKSKKVTFDSDEFIRTDASLEAMAKLKPVFKKSEDGGSVTAANASGLNDGAAALLVASDDALNKYQLKPLAKIVSSAVVGVTPSIMGIGPVEATQTALTKAGISLDQLDIIEINEAFASQSIACLRELGIRNDDPRVNPNGGAIALGHPLGMSGARILLSAALELQLTNKRYALATMCVGVGQGYAVVLENQMR